LKKKSTQIQQGDVLIEACAIPSDVTPLQHRVLREGEHTGHKHLAVIDEIAPDVSADVTPDVTLFIQESTGTLFMRVSGGDARVVHEEHNDVEVTAKQLSGSIPPGEYRVGAVREFDYDSEESRFVQD